jgi:hypothetical protein
MNRDIYVRVGGGYQKVRKFFLNINLNYFKLTEYAKKRFPANIDINQVRKIK